jgi:clan AA aspartic protease (TIGR02281 family)
MAFRGIVTGFLTGLGLGFILMYYFWNSDENPPTTRSPQQDSQVQLVNTPSSPAAKSPPARTATGTETAKPFSVDLRKAVVELSLLDAEGRVTAHFHSARIGKDRVLVLPLALVSQADALRIDRQYENVRVLAADTATGLVAVDSDDHQGPYLELAQEEHPLYLARDLVFLTAVDRIDGWVDGFQTRLSNSALWMAPIRLQQAAQAQGGVLVDAQTARLLGLIVLQPDQEGRLGAVDVSAISALLKTIQHSEPRSLAAFLQDYRRTTPAGMWVEIQRLIRAGDYPEAIALAEALLNLDWSFREQVIPLLENLLTRQVNLHLQRQESAQALEWLERVRPLLSDQGSIYLLYNTTYLALGEFEQAQHALYDAVQRNPELRKQAAAQLRQTLASAIRQLEQQLDSHRLVALLEEAVRFDPDVASYHHSLGLYYLKQGNPAAAIASLTRAMELDNSLVGPLTELIKQARNRLDNRVFARIPFQQVNGIIYVRVQINGYQEAFRFIFDTGASHTVIARALAKQLGIEIPADAPQLWIQTANDRVRATRVTLASVNLGGVIVNNVPALVMDTLGDVDGLLGSSYLRFFNVAIEQQEGYLTLMRN